MKLIYALSCLIISVKLCVPASATEFLTDDLSRGELLRYSATLKGKSLGRSFLFPDGTSPSQRPQSRPNAVFGVDVSHYEGKIVWSTVPEQGIRFVFVKASQGEHSIDDQFDNNWKGLGAVAASKNMMRGAYHFMSADGDAAAQAANFVNQVGKLDQPFDLPPSLDMEWDFKFVGHSQVDAWSHYTPAQIVQKIITWANLVEGRTGKQPIIYTNANWWVNRIGNAKELTKYNIWIADYANGDLKHETPATLAPHNVPLWQFTDKAILTKGGSAHPMDASVFYGTDLSSAFTAVPKR